MQVLVALTRRAEDVVSRDELLALCWSGRIVGEDAIQRSIAKVRQLGKASGTFAVETIPRVGYRLVPIVLPALADGCTMPSGGRDSTQREPLNLAADLPRAAQAVTKLPSVGVLPLLNLTGDVTLDYFVDGISEDIITALSRFHEFRTAPRGATFTHRGNSGDPAETGRRMGLQYILTGTVRQAEDRVRVSVELTHCASGQQIWRDSFDRGFAGVFDLQDELSRSVAAVLFPALRSAEVEQARHIKARDTTAYDLYLRALPHMWAGVREDILQAIALLRDSLEREPTAAVLGALSFSLLLAPPLGAMPRADALPEALRLARRAMELDFSDSFIQATYSTALSVTSTDHGQVALHAEEAVRLNPSSAFAWGALGVSRCLIGEFEHGLVGLEMATRLSPSDVLVYFWRTFEAAAAFALERFEEGVSAARSAMMHNPNYGTAHRLLAANLAMLGRTGEAREVTRRRDLEQRTSLEEIGAMGLFQQTSIMARYVAAQRLCGVT